jgi:putative hydrolase of the HAD superfamily
VSSAEVGLHKPDPRIFELACARLGVAPSEAAHVGDHHYADLLGARAIGMNAILIDRTGAGVFGADPIADFTDIERRLGL